MSQWNSNDTGNILRITAEDAQSQHVEDLLKRQMSLRGEQGITRDQGRKWYYQNWFIFAIAGLIGALAGWAILEPYFQDMTYIQGTVTSIGPVQTISEKNETVTGGNSTKLISFETIQVGKFPIIVSTEAHRFDPKAKFPSISLDSIKRDEFLGFYVDHRIHMDRGNVQNYAAAYVDFHPVSDVPTTQDMLDKQETRQNVISFFFFAIIAGAVGLAIGAADGIMCRTLGRVLLAGGIGLLVGFIGGFVSGMLAEFAYAPLREFAEKHSGALGFSLQTTGRGLAWCLAGMTMGLGQGIALRSKRLLLYGLLGGLIGGLLGGLLFDPISLLRGARPSGAVSRLVALGVVGAVVGLMIGIVERLARDAWLRMVEGPLAGKEFLIFKDVMRMGASPRAEIYLFNDDQVTAQHAILRSTGDIYELENTCRDNPVCINGRPITRSRLRHGDRISLGRTAFVFQRQRGE